MGRGWIVILIKTLINCILFINVSHGQNTKKPLYEKYGDSLSVLIFQDNDLLKASQFIERIDNKIEKKGGNGLGIYYYYKAIYLKKIGDDEYMKLLLLSLKELNKSDNYFVYKILANEQLSRFYKKNENFKKELYYLNKALESLKKYHMNVAPNISDRVLRSYFISLQQNNKSEQALLDAKWIDVLADNDTTKIICYLNAANLIYTIGATRDEILLYKKILSIIEDNKNFNEFYLPTISGYSIALKHIGLFQEVENLFFNSIEKIETEFNDSQKIEFYLLYAYFIRDNKEKLRTIISILDQKRFDQYFSKNKGLSNRFFEFKNILIDNRKHKIQKILEHEKAIDLIKNKKSSITESIIHYGELIGLYQEVSDTAKSRSTYSKLKNVFKTNELSLSQVDLWHITESSLIFDDIELALEAWKLRLDLINQSICLNFNLTNHEFDYLFKMQRIIVFQATGFNLKYGNFPELQKKIIVFHELLKQRMNHEFNFLKHLNTLNYNKEYKEKINEFTSLDNLLVLSVSEQERLKYLKRFFSKQADFASNNDCEVLKIGEYVNKKRTILYYTAIKADGAEFYRLYTISDGSKFNPFKFYFDLDKKPERKLNDQFTQTQISNLNNVNIENSDEILISRTADLNFVNFSVYKNEIDFITGKDTKIRLINSLKDIDKLTDEKYSRDTEIIAYGDIDYDNIVIEKPISIGDQQNIISSISTNLNRSSIGSWAYLPGTLKEIKMIRDLAKSKNISSRIITGANANEKSLRYLSEKPNPYILHLATHGYFFDKLNNNSTQNLYTSNDNPLIRSGIVLAGANRVWDEKSNVLSNNDGILTSKEILNLNLKNCKLLILSACDTGLGVFGTDNVEGLQKAFKIAGVDKIIMSLSKIPDDKTPIFFEFFYSELFKGLTIHSAFTNTQKEMRKRYGFEDDFWTSFILLE